MRPGFLSPNNLISAYAPQIDRSESVILPVPPREDEKLAATYDNRVAPTQRTNQENAATKDRTPEIIEQLDDFEGEALEAASNYTPASRAWLYEQLISEIDAERARSIIDSIVQYPIDSDIVRLEEISGKVASSEIRDMLIDAVAFLRLPSFSGYIFDRPETEKEDRAVDP